MSDSYLITFAKSADSVMNNEYFIQFLAFWYRVAKYHPVILAYLQSTIPSNDDAISKIEQKTALKTAQASKKIKHIDNLVATKNTRITALRDQWLIHKRKANTEIKT